MNKDKKRAIHTDLVQEKLLPELLRMNVEVPADVRKALELAREKESGPARIVLDHILENLFIAEKRQIPMCQDTGLVIVFVEAGRNIEFSGRSLDLVISDSIEKAWEQGYFRKSVVADPLKDRKNTGNNLPALVYYEYNDSDRLRISCLAKGFGSENYSRTRMLKPTDGREEIIEFAVDVMKEAKGNCCPPVYLGVGIGGTMDWASRISKKALLRHLDEKHPDPWYAKLEDDILDRINELGIGGGGLGGEITALGVKIEKYATHIAGLPVAISVNCWAERRAEVIL
ncbi:MAG: fumarate hydratase [Spirochaetales bacterium]|nr:fumarate hydratase [Spirochaetales bacterium]